MKQRLTRILSAVLLMISATGCSLFKDRDPEYYGAAETQPLVIPEGLDSPVSSTALTIETVPMPLPERELSDVPPRVVANQASKNANTSMHWSAEGVYILVKDAPESVERRLGLVIERSGLQMQGRAPGGGYQFDYDHIRVDNNDGWFSWIAFWRQEPPDFSGTYQTFTSPEGQHTRVFLRYADGGEVPMEAAEHVLAIIKERLG